MIIRLKVFEQTLSIIDTRTIPRQGSKEYLVLQFTFSGDWKDLDKLCYLQKDDVSQPMDVVDGLVEVPEWFTQQDSFDVTLFGKSGGKEVPTNVVALKLQKSNTLWEQDAPEPQPSWLAKVIDLSNHPPVPGENGYWLIWNTDKGAYSESELPLPACGVQSDWNQNDETQLDYVKNRPFYTGDPVETVLLEETTVEFSDMGGGLYRVESPVDFSLEVAQTYQVSWDGAVYECIGYDFNRVVAIGNQSILTSVSDTGEPFIAATYEGICQIFTKDTSASHNISVRANVAPVTKIDKKYLPEDAPYLSNTNPTGTGSFSLNRLSGSEIGYNSFAEGSETTASGQDSHAEGFSTTASGYRSHAEGCETTSSSDNSHAEGDRTTASGPSSHAEGAFSQATRYYSHAEGFHTYASSENQHVQGKYNIKDSSGTYAHIVGNGTADYARSNAHTLDWSGNAWFAGTVEGKAIILLSSTEGSTKKFKITVDDSGALTATEVT